MAGDDLRPGAKRHPRLEVLRAVFGVPNLVPIPIEFALDGRSASSIVVGYDAVHPVRRQEAVGNALVQTVEAKRIAEVGVSDCVLFATRRRGHPDLGCGLDPLQYFTLGVVLPRSIPVALVHRDQVEEVPTALAKEAGSAVVSCHRLVGVGDVRRP